LAFPHMFGWNMENTGLKKKCNALFRSSRVKKYR
jgi:hypothetical protein